MRGLMKNAATILIIVLSSFFMVFGSSLPDLVISSENNYWKTGTFSLVNSGPPDIIVDTSSKKQYWEGFGGTFNEMGWDALSVIKSEIPNALKLLFDADDGAGFIFGRVPIGASDYSMNWYTLAETSNDYSMGKIFDCP